MYLSFSEGAGRFINYIPYIAEKERYERFVQAVIKVESGGNPLAIGADMDYGLFQITPIRIKDYNMRTGNNHKHEDCFNPEISREIFDYYANRIGKDKHEEIAKRWNTWSKLGSEAAIKYWNKIKSYL
jgi:hypothetical protein